jgi:hypothetical protein
MGSNRHHVPIGDRGSPANVCCNTVSPSSAAGGTGPFLHPTGEEGVDFIFRVRNAMVAPRNTPTQVVG